MAKILVAEDEEKINDLICRNLRLVGHEPQSVFDGAQALETLCKNDFDLALFDVMLPSMSGFELAKALTKDIPFIFVTAKDNLTSKLEGLDIGAYDYIIKPFEILELLARINNCLKRTKKNDRIFELLGVKVNLDLHSVMKGDEEILLTPKEFLLLEALIINRNLALSREKLLELVWEFDYEGECRTVDVHIQRLRKKLGWEEVIQTVYKMGYRLKT